MEIRDVSAEFVSVTNELSIREPRFLYIASDEGHSPNREQDEVLLMLLDSWKVDSNSTRYHR